MLEGEQAVKEGVIDEVGGIREALDKLYALIEERKFTEMIVFLCDFGYID